MRYRTINWILAITVILSILTVLQIFFEFVQINPFDFDADKIEQVNNIVLGFALGYIVNSIFYLLTTIVPHELNKTRATGIVTPYLSDIYNRFQITLLYLNSKFGKTPPPPISSTDLLSFTKLSNSNLSFTFQEQNNGAQTPHSYNNFTEIDFFEEERDLVLKNIEVVLANPFLSGLDDKLIYTLTKLKTELFYIGVKRFAEYRNISPHFSYKDFEKYVKEHFDLINEYFVRVEYLKDKLTIKDFR